jgi:hypothetical protein
MILRMKDDAAGKAACQARFPTKIQQPFKTTEYSTKQIHLI